MAVQSANPLHILQQGRRPTQGPLARLGAPSSLCRASHSRLLRGLLRPQGLAAPGYDEYVLEHLRREEFYAPRADDSKGFSNDIFTTVLAPKPYTYHNRPGVNTIHKKLEVRESMTNPDYMLAYLKMVRDPRAKQAHLVYYFMEQLLAEDALLRHWGVARAWSQNTLDEIERGTYTWHDSQT